MNRKMKIWMAVGGILIILGVIQYILELVAASPPGVLRTPDAAIDEAIWPSGLWMIVGLVLVIGIPLLHKAAQFREWKLGHFIDRFINRG